MSGIATDMESCCWAMKLKLDENLSRHLKPILEEQNFDVLTVSDAGLLCNLSASAFRVNNLCERL